MGIEHSSSIAKVSKKAVDFKKKKAAGQDNTADQTRVLSVSARVEAIKSKIQNSKRSGLNFLSSENDALKKNQDFSIRKKHEGAKLKPQVPAGVIDKFQKELQAAQKDLATAKQDFSKRMDEAILSGSGEDIASLRSDFQNVKEAQGLNREAQDLHNDPKAKDPDLMRKIHNKTSEVTNLTLEKGKPGKLQSLMTAKQELAELKTQLYQQQ